MRLARSDILDLLNLAANCPLPKDSVAFEAARFAELDVPAVHETPLPAAPPGKNGQITSTKSQTRTKRQNSKFQTAMSWNLPGGGKKIVDNIGNGIRGQATFSLSRKMSCGAGGDWPKK
jgi:hypothetical protein